MTRVLCVSSALLAASLTAAAEPAVRPQRPFAQAAPQAAPTLGPGEDRLALADDKEKKRVPKTEDEKAKKKQEEDKKEAQANATDDDDDCWGLCIFGFLDALFSDEESTTSLVADGGSVAPGVLGSGVLLQTDSLRTPIQLWTGPGGAALGYETAGMLEPGTLVAVTSHEILESVSWLEVQTRKEELVTGWVPESAVDWVLDDVPPQTPAEPPVEEVPPARSAAGLILGADFSFLGLAGPTEVRDEYVVLGRFGVSVHYAFENTLKIGLAAGYGYADGDPLYNYDYLAGTRRDSPQNSSLEVFDTAIRLGQSLLLGSSTRFGWEVGAVYNWVQESADIEVYSLPSELPLGETSVSQTRWRWGADLAVGASWPVSERVWLGLQARAFWIPWDGAGTESLTLDHIGTKTIVGVGLAGTLSFDAF